MNKTVVTTLPVASPVSYHVPNTVSVRGQKAVAESKKAPHPVIGLVLETEGRQRFPLSWEALTTRWQRFTTLLTTQRR
jgi:hypothetical protein